MKKLFLCIFASLAIIGCTQKVANTIENNKVAVVGGREVCYKDVVYVKFNEYDDRASWGGVRMTKEGKVVTCEESANGAS